MHIYFRVTLIIIIYLYRWFEWEAIERDGVHWWSPKSSERIFKQLEDVGRQLALTFNEEGSVLATGGEVGFVFPAMFALTCCVTC